MRSSDELINYFIHWINIYGDIKMIMNQVKLFVLKLFFNTLRKTWKSYDKKIIGGFNFKAYSDKNHWGVSKHTLIKIENKPSSIIIWIKIIKYINLINLFPKIHLLIKTSHNYMNCWYKNSNKTLIDVYINRE